MTQFNVPKGWALVPMEAAPEMEQAAEKYWNERRFKSFSADPRTWQGVYAAMLAAAPAAPVVQAEPVAVAITEKQCDGLDVWDGRPEGATHKDQDGRFWRISGPDDGTGLVWTQQQGWKTSEISSAFVAKLDALAEQEPVATILPPDPLDERSGPWLSLEDWERLRALPAGTRLYAAPMSQVDVAAKLESMAASHGEQLNWCTSIVDLLKLLGLDSSLEARRNLATELGCPPDRMADSAEMNTWLHREVMRRLADTALAARDQLAEPDEERLAMEAVMESVDPATWPGLTAAQRCALGRFAKPQTCRAVSKTDDARALVEALAEIAAMEPEPGEPGSFMDDADFRYLKCLRKMQEIARAAIEAAMAAKRMW